VPQVSSNLGSHLKKGKKKRKNEASSIQKKNDGRIVLRKFGPNNWLKMKLETVRKKGKKERGIPIHELQQGKKKVMQKM